MEPSRVGVKVRGRVKRRLGRDCLLVLTVAGLCLPVADGTASGAQEAVDCGRADTLCVGVVNGSQQEFSTIQAAVNRSRAGDTVVVFPGDYAGFRIARSGTASRRIVVSGQPGARITSSERRSDDGIYLRRSSFVTIRGFEIKADNMRYGIGGHDARAKKPMRGVEILDNVVVNARTSGIYMSHTADSLIAGNISSGAQKEHGIYLANAGSDNTILRGNTCYGNAINGIHFNGDARYGGDGVLTGLVVDGNVLFANAANGFDADGVRSSSFINNVVYDNGRHALRVFAIDAAAGPADLVIANNTFVDNRGWAIKLTQDDGGHTIFNNIMLSRSGSLAVDDPDFVADHNIGKTYSLDGERTVIGRKEWQAAGHGAHSFRASRNKLFTKPNREDFTLKAGSPAIDAGVTILAGQGAPPLDVNGEQRPRGAAVDLGAYERDAAREP